MYSGKSSELIRRIRRFHSIAMRVKVINHKDDNRYGVTGVETHYGDTIKAIRLSKLANFIKHYIKNGYPLDVARITSKATVAIHVPPESTVTATHAAG